MSLRPFGPAGRRYTLLNREFFVEEAGTIFKPLQFGTDTGEVTVCLVEHLQAYLDSTPVS